MIPRLVPEMSPCDAFCDVVGVLGIGDSRRAAGEQQHDLGILVVRFG